jgi:hypothetical protein
LDNSRRIFRRACDASSGRDTVPVAGNDVARGIENFQVRDEPSSISRWPEDVLATGAVERGLPGDVRVCR